MIPIKFVLRGWAVATIFHEYFVFYKVIPGGGLRVRVGYISSLQESKG